MDLSIPSNFYIRISDSTVLLRLNKTDEIILMGRVNVKAIRGVINIFGYEITPDQPPTAVFSAVLYNTFKVTCVNSDEGNGIDKLFLESLDITGDKIDKILKRCNKHSHIFIVSQNRAFEDNVTFLHNYGFSLVPKEKFVYSSIELTTTNSNFAIVSEEWEHIANNFIDRTHKTVICGGKNVGKSTLLKYFVNRSLIKWSEVLVIDLDPGQNEFTVMGCLNVVLVKQPLLGPNFSHLISPIRSLFLGSTSPGDCFQLYMKYVEEIANFSIEASQFKNIPWFINTTGFTKGIGIKLLEKIIEAIKPTDIVQINSKFEKNNFPVPLNRSYLQCTVNFKSHVLSSLITSIKDQHGSLKNTEPATRRNIVTMSYFKKCLSNQFDLLEVPPTKMKLSHLEIIIRKPSSGEIEMMMTTYQKLCCINGNMIALCYMDTHDIMHCVGFGIVRGFDIIKTEYVYIITPLSEIDLESVKILQLSANIFLPSSVYMKQVTQVHGPCPYISYKYPNKLNEQFKRTSGRIKYVEGSNSSDFIADKSN